MSIIEEAEKVKWKETGEKIANTLQEIDYPNKDLAFYELLRYFDITNPDELKNPEILKKAETIFQYFKDSEDILKALRELNSKLGNPIDLTEKLNKIYSFVYSENLEKGFQKEKEIEDTRLAKELQEKREEKEKLKIREEKRIKMEKIKEIRKKQNIELAEYREKLQKQKKEKELAEKIAEIERAKKPKLPPLPKIKI